MDNPAGHADLEALGYDGGKTAAVQERWLGVAWRALQHEPGVPDIPAAIEAGTLDVDVVIDIICAAALRALNNLDGNVSEDVAIDDYRESWRKAESTVSNDIYFTAAEKRRLTPAWDYGGGYIGSIKYC
ncbi:hypothetical protein [Microbacterium sp.]|uniref:hypothetical protein n=1 Tax=Microbacterium sp. TaxID=51671 RepID=UPI003736BC70